MRITAHDEVAEVIISKDEFHFFIHSIGADEEYKTQGITNHIISAISSYCSKAVISEYEKAGKHETVAFLTNPYTPLSVELTGCSDGSVYVKFAAVTKDDVESESGLSCLSGLVEMLRNMTQASLGEDYTDEDDDYFDDLDEQAMNGCMQCFWDSVIDDMIDEMLEVKPDTTANDAIAQICISHCYQTLLNSLEEDSQAQFCQEVMAYVEKKFETKETIRYIYRVENLDLALRVMQFVKRGAIVKRHDKYYVVSDKNYSVLGEYGDRVDSHLYWDEEDLLTYIKDGEFCKRRDFSW